VSLVDGLVRASLPLIPRRVLWTVAQRYVAGDELEDALDAIGRLRSEGFGTILDVLGEGVETEAQARDAAAEYHRALERLPAIDAHTVISVKPTHLGLLLGGSGELCAGLLSELCAAAAAQGRRVRLEMEDAPTVDATLAVFSRLRRRHANLGCVLQARLFRTRGDAERLLAEGHGLNVRLVKGIYLEPPAIAWTENADISRSYLELARLLLDGGAFVGLATHDSTLGEQLLAALRERGLDRGPAERRSYEFQLLLGVRRDQADAWRQAGHHVRIYVPYGRDWHAYSLRRLRRNPQIARHVLRALVTRRA
jgi:proline dehydrogenase